MLSPTSIFKRGICLILILALLLFTVGCERAVGHLEITIRLPRDFVEYDTGGAYDVAYSDDNLIVAILRLSFDACMRDSIPTTLDAEGFAKFYQNRGEGLDDMTVVVETEDIVYFTYTMLGNDGGRYFYMPTFYVSPNAYFIITFITDYNYLEAAMPDILDYSSTVRIDMAR